MGSHFPKRAVNMSKAPSRHQRVYIIASASLSKNTTALKDLKEALAGKVAGVRVGMRPHTFLSEVLEVIKEVEKVDADLIVTLGGGSLSDAAKLVAFAVGNNAETEEDVMKLPHMANPDVKAKPPKCPLICIPTSLSGGEYNDYAGVTRDSDNQKFQFSSPLKAPKLIILDAQLAVTTPLNIWLQSGVRSIDHCIEPFCQLEIDQVVEEACVKGLQCLVPGLLNTVRDPSDKSARHDCQIAVPSSMTPMTRHTFPGASHGIGHMLGPLGVGHGETSGILLPAVCKYNAKYKANNDRQALACELLWKIEEASKVFKAKGLEQDTADLGDLIDAIVRQLGLPRTLSEVGVPRKEFDHVAVNSLEDLCCQQNPVHLERKEQVLEILEMCA